MICLHSLVLSKKIQVLLEKCAKFVQARSRKLPPKYCARIVPYKFCTFSAHFLMPPRMFRTNFQGPLRTTPRTYFCIIFSDVWYVLKICLCTGESCLKDSGRGGSSEILYVHAPFRVLTNFSRNSFGRPDLVIWGRDVSGKSCSSETEERGHCERVSSLKESLGSLKLQAIV